jgi:F-type H+-transporting ATPase subunit gamma
MSDTIESLRRKIASATELQSVVRTMKALAASSIGQYENSVRALAAYNHAVELGLSVCFGGQEPVPPEERSPVRRGIIGAVVFGSDQGLVGQFNDVIADYAVEAVAKFGGKVAVWAVGERVEARLTDAGLDVVGRYPVPNSVQAITALVAQIRIETDARLPSADQSALWVFHNRPQSGAQYQPVAQRLLPLDSQWRRDLAARRWPTGNRPEMVGSGRATLRALVGEYLFILLFRACAESLASENASRLAAMQRAEKNIGDLQEHLQRSFHQLRQSSIDEELFEVVAAFESMAGMPPQKLDIPGQTAAALQRGERAESATAEFAAAEPIWLTGR